MIKISKYLKTKLSPGDWYLATKERDFYYGLWFDDYTLVKIENENVIEIISIGLADVAGVYESIVNTAVQEIMYKNKHDGCYERPEYYLLELYKRGNTVNCMRVRHLDTNKELNWHTDGYYTDQNNSVLAWMLFCKVAAESGGTNKYLDHEIAYILFNNKSKRLMDLMLDDTCCIPENSITNRKEVFNPVFMFKNKRLHMKFSMRKKNIIWNKNSLQAIDMLKSIIKDSSEYHITKKLDTGMGVITNNVIHMRTAFTNSKNKNRLLYRLRSKKRVTE